MLSNLLKLRAFSAPWRDGIEFFLVTDEPGQPRQIATDFTMATLPAAGAAMTLPTFTLSLPAAQQLMDELWNAGMRPTEGAGSAGQLAAVERHLADQRELARRLLDQVLKGAPHGTDAAPAA